MVLKKIPGANSKEEKLAILEELERKFGFFYPSKRFEEAVMRDPDSFPENFTDGFVEKVSASPEWDDDPGLALKIYDALVDLQSRIASHPKGKDGLWLFWPLMLSLVFKASRGDFSACIPRIEAGMKSRDHMVREAAVKLIDCCGSGRKLELALQYMELHGIDLIPYLIGEILAREVGDDPDKLAWLKGQLQSSRGKKREGLLKTVEMMKGKAELFKSELVAIARDGSGEEQSLAIIALGHVEKATEEIEVLLMEATRSKHYYLRGNSLVSASLLGIDPDFFINRARELLNDREGYDWNVQECAVQAIGNWGPKAAGLKGDIESLKRGAEEEDFINLIDETIAKISGKAGE